MACLVGRLRTWPPLLRPQAPARPPVRLAQLSKATPACPPLLPPPLYSLLRRRCCLCTPTPWAAGCPRCAATWPTSPESWASRKGRCTGERERASNPRGRAARPAAEAQRQRRQCCRALCNSEVACALGLPAASANRHARPPPLLLATCPARSLLSGNPGVLRCDLSSVTYAPKLAFLREVLQVRFSWARRGRERRGGGRWPGSGWRAGRWPCTLRRRSLPPSLACRPPPRTLPNERTRPPGGAGRPGGGAGQEPAVRGVPPGPHRLARLLPPPPRPPGRPLQRAVLGLSVRCGSEAQRAP